MLERVQYIKENIIPITANIIEKTEVEFEIVQLNKNQLYDNGMDSKNNKLSPYRSRYYADMKFELRGKELTDLFLKGDWQREFHIIISNDRIQYDITSSDEKTVPLVEKYGENIFGLNQENKEIAFPIIKPYLLEEVNNILQCEIV